MKSILSLLILPVLFTSSGLAQEYKAITFNIRYDTPNDGQNRWDNRKYWINEIILDESPDFLGVQEAVHHQAMYMDSSLTDYTFIGVARDDGRTQGEYSPLFIHTDYEIVDSGTFWLSETPDVPSKGWDAALNRVCTYAIVKDSDDVTFLVMNAHFDHIGVVARLESMRLITSKAEQLSEGVDMAIIMGDFNAVPDSDPIRHISSLYTDSFIMNESPPPHGTYHGFNRDYEMKDRIDYIFTKNLIVNSYSAPNYYKDGLFPSDHLPIIITFETK